MPRAAAGLAPEYRDAVAALERTMSGQLRDELAAAGADRGDRSDNSGNAGRSGHSGLAEEFRRRRDDYRTWHRMDEVPRRVAEVAGRLTRGEPAPAVRRELELAVLAAMVRAHERALAETAGANGSAVANAGAGSGSPQGQ